MSFIAVGVGGLAAAGTFAAGATAATVLGAAGLGLTAGSMLSNSMGQKKAADVVGNLQYQPIDLDKLQEQAQGYAQQNIAKSIELEKQYMPDVSAARFGLQKQVAQDLARGGNLPPDVANQVTRASMARAGAGGFGAGPLTAAQLGLSSLDLRNQAQAKAAALTATNPLPVSGLDPGSLASAAIGQNQAQNQFALGKAGALTNVYQSQANTSAANVGNLAALASMWPKGTTPGTAGSNTGFSMNNSLSIPTTATTPFDFGGNYRPIPMGNVKIGQPVVVPGP
jgi:hypothetical protein